MAGAVHLVGSASARDDIERQARKLAAMLKENGVAAGGAVAILMRNDASYLTAIEACRYLGVRFVPLNWHAAPAEVGSILKDSGAAALIGHADLVEPVRPHIPAPFCVVSCATPPELGSVYPEARTVPGGQTLAQIVAPFDEIPTPPLPFKGIFAYTSGSTGRPKGIQRQPRPGVSDHVEVYRMMAERLLGLRPGDRLYVPAPLYHSAPNGLALFGFYGPSVDLHLAPKFDPVGFLEEIERSRITHVYVVPTMMVRLLKLPLEQRRQFDLSSLRFAFSCGSACPHDVKAAMIEWLGPIVYESYGSSELGFMTLINSDDAMARPGSVGKVLPGGSILILDDDLNELPPGETGAIYVSLPANGDFNYSNAEGNLADQRYRGHTTVGDVGYLDADGFVFISDRKKDMIITGGANVFPAEIEAHLFQMPQVVDCAVFGVPDPEYGEAIAAAVQCRPGQTLALEEVHAFLAGKIARFKFPRQLDLHDELPREDSGKVFKRRLREPYWAEAGAPA